MRKSKKKLSVIILAFGLVLSSAFTSLAAWEQSEQGWKYKDDTIQQYVTDKWVESASEKGLWYYVNVDGIMATNTLVDGVYFVNENGEWREDSQSSSTQTGGATHNSNQGNTWDGNGVTGQVGDHPLPFTDEEIDAIQNATFY